MGLRPIAQIAHPTSIMTIKQTFLIMKFGEAIFRINMKQVLKVGFFALIALGVSVGLWFFLNGYLTKSKASETEATIAFSEIKKTAKGGEIINVGLTVTAGSGMSAVDLTFETTGENLNFLYPQTTGTLPVGFDDKVLNENMMTTQTTYGTKALRRIMFVSKKSEATLPRSIFIPLHFAIVNNGTVAAHSTISVKLATSQVSGPSIPGNLFSLKGDRSPIDFTVEIEDPRAASVTNFICEPICGSSMVFKWAASPNATGYKVLKDGQELKNLTGQGTNAYPYNWCGDFNTHNFAVIAYNEKGSVSTTAPTIPCGCQRCPTPAPPTPTPIRPTNSADLIFRVKFPDVDSTVVELPNIQVQILGDGGEHVCLDGADCVQIATFTRMGTSNYFASPQMQFNLKENKPYSVVVKQAHTLRRTYKHVFLKWQQVLVCFGTGSESGCGQLISEIDARPLYSGDLQGLDPTLDGYNIININDLTSVGVISDTQLTLNKKTAEGDMNFDGGTDVKDYGIVARNLGKKGD